MQPTNNIPNNDEISKRDWKNTMIKQNITLKCHSHLTCHLTCHLTFGILDPIVNRHRGRLDETFQGHVGPQGRADQLIGYVNHWRNCKSKIGRYCCISSLSTSSLLHEVHGTSDPMARTVISITHNERWYKYVCWLQAEPRYWRCTDKPPSRFSRSSSASAPRRDIRSRKILRTVDIKVEQDWLTTLGT